MNHQTLLSGDTMDSYIFAQSFAAPSSGTMSPAHTVKGEDMAMDGVVAPEVESQTLTT